MLTVKRPLYRSLKRDSVTRFFASGFFHPKVSPQPQSIPFGPFRIFSKIRGDIRRSRLTTGVVDTGGKWKKSSIRKIFIILLGHLWIVEVTHLYIFAFKFTLRSAAWYYCHCLPPVSTTLVKLVVKFAAGVVDTGGKFATGVADTGGQPWAADISANFEKIRNGPNGILRGFVGNWFMKKTRSKNLVTLSLLKRNGEVII